MSGISNDQALYARRLDEKYGFPSGTMETLVNTESSGDGKATSSKGARGYGQLMPSAMTDAGMKGVDPASLSYREQLNIAANHLNKGFKRFGDIGLALAGYNAGNGRVNAVRNGKSTLPGETADYVRKFADAGIIPPDSEVIQHAQLARTGASKKLSEPDYSKLDEDISSVGNTSAWDAKRAQFKEQATAGQQDSSQPPATEQAPTDSWEAKRAQFLASQQQGQQPEQQQIARSNLNPEMEYLPPGLTSAPEQALRGIANIPSDLMDAGVGVINAAGNAAAWANGVLGVNGGEFTPMSPVARPVAQPTDQYARLGEEIGPYLIPGVGAERTAAAIASAANSGRAERAATSIAGMLGENLPGTLASSQQNGQIDPSKLAEETALGLFGSLAGRAVVGGVSKATDALQGIRARSASAEPAAAIPAANGLPDTLSSSAERVGRAAQTGDKGRIAEVVNDIQPDKNTVDAARQLGLDPDDMLEAYTSGNDAFKAVQMALASQDESVLAKVKRDSINRISERASKIIDDAGAMPDRLAMNDKFKADFESSRNALKAKERELYKPIQDAIPPRSAVDAVNTRNQLDSMADDVGGYQHLSSVEKKVYDAVSPMSENSGQLTYQRLNNMRAMVGSELDRAGTPFGSTEERNLSQLYAVLSKDRDAVAASAGFIDQVKAANAVTAQRKMMEKRVYELLGKDLSGDVTVKAKSALDGLQSGNTQPFIRLMRSVPDKEARSQIIATGMRDMLRKGSRSDLANNINGLVDFYGDLKRKGTIRLLANELPPETMKELDSFYTLGRNVKSANAYHLQTGKLNGFLKKFDQPGGFIDQLSKHGKMSLIATAMGHVPVVGPVLNTSIAAHMGAKAASRKTGAQAAQDLMVSPVWRDMVNAAKTSKSQAKQNVASSHFEKRIAAMPAWKEFYRSLPAAEKAKIARVGIIGWLSGEAEGDSY